MLPDPLLLMLRLITPPVCLSLGLSVSLPPLSLIRFPSVGVRLQADSMRLRESGQGIRPAFPVCHSVCVFCNAFQLKTHAIGDTSRDLRLVTDRLTPILPCLVYK